MRNEIGNGGAVLAPRLTVRRGAAGLLVAEALPVVAWALLWAAFLAAVSPAPPRRLAGVERPGPASQEAPVEALVQPCAPPGRG